MKNFKFLFVLMVTLGVLVTSCSKIDDDPADIIDNLAKGSIDLTIDGKTFNKLFTSVTFSTEEQMVSFYAFQPSSETSFLMAFGPVPNIGETVTLTLDDDDEDAPVVILTGSFDPSLEHVIFYSKSGTIHRNSQDKYTLDVEVVTYDQANTYSLKGTVTVGATN